MKDFLRSLKITLTFCIFLSVGYVAVLWAVAVVAGPNGGQADVVAVHGQTVGVANVGQAFTGTYYFWGRPSAVDYNGAGSGGSNKATTNPEYLREVEKRIDAFLVAHPCLQRRDVPSEMVTASGSGLDPDLSPAAAYIQVRRVAQTRGIPEQAVRELVDRAVQKPWLGLFGTSRVNVLKLNVALDRLKPYRSQETSGGKPARQSLRTK